MDLENPIGTLIPWPNAENAKQVIGVVKDYHFLSLQEPISPLLIHIDPQFGNVYTLLVRLKPQQIREGIQAVEKAWQDIAPNKPFEFTFLDEDVALQYKNDRRWMKILGVATSLAILIAGLGLFGLSGIKAANKTKEIGIQESAGGQCTTIVVAAQ